MRAGKKATIGATLGAALALAAFAAPAWSAVPHVVTPGETLSGIAAANGVSTEALASANGISADSYVIVGQTLAIPAATTTATTTSTSTSTSAPVAGLAAIYCPCGTVYLRSDAAAAWTSMRDASLRDYGVDLYPNGPLSAYRTYDQQAELYRLFLSGQGAPADPPGTSSHELGTAVDVATPAMRSVVDSIGSQYGWGKVHGPGEWWHVDYLG